MPVLEDLNFTISVLAQCYPIFQLCPGNRIRIGIYKKFLHKINKASLTRLGRRAAVAVGKFNMSHSAASPSDRPCLLGNIKVLDKSVTEKMSFHLSSVKEA